MSVGPGNITDENQDDIAEDDQAAKQAFNEFSEKLDGNSLDDSKKQIEPDTESQSELESTSEASQPADDESEPADEAPQPDDASDPWANAPEALKTRHQALLEQNKKLEQANRSHQGRLSAMQRQINQQQTQPPTADNNQPSADDVQEAMKTPEQWATFKEDYPEIHAAVESRMAQSSLQTQTQTQQLIDEAIQPLQAAEQERAQARELAALKAAHPDWDTVVQSSDFNSWMAGQPPQIRTILEGDTANEVSAVLDFFKSTRPVSKKTSAMEKKHDQLRKTAGIPSKPGGGHSSGIPSDPRAAFDHFSRHI